MPAISLLLMPLLAARPAQAADIALVGARIEVGDGRVVENGTIVMRADKIVLIGAGLEPPAGARVVDVRGKTVMPGFVDCYKTGDLILPDAPPSGKDLPDTTTTAPATMWHENRKGIRANVHAATQIDPKATFESRVSQGVTTALLAGGTGSIAGTAALVDLTAKPTVVVPDAAEEFVFQGGGRFGGGEDEDMAGAQGRRPADATTPTYNYPGTLFGVFGLMRQTLWDAKAYADVEKPKEDPTYEGLRPLMAGKMPALFTMNTSREITRAGHLADEFGFRMIVNGVPDAYRALDAIKAHHAPVIVSLAIPDAPSTTVTADSAPKRVLEDRLAQYKARLANARILDEAGVPIAFRKGSDDYLVGVRALVKASGLSRASALRAMSLSPARIFGVADRMGTLEAGKAANVVVLSGDFLDEKTKVDATYVDGVLNETKKETAK